jgi:hypothetical protein
MLRCCKCVGVKKTDKQFFKNIEILSYTFYNFQYQCSVRVLTSFLTESILTDVFLRCSKCRRNVSIYRRCRRSHNVVRKWWAKTRAIYVPRVFKSVFQKCSHFLHCAIHRYKTDSKNSRSLLALSLSRRAQVLTPIHFNVTEFLPLPRYRCRIVVVGKTHICERSHLLMTLNWYQFPSWIVYTRSSVPRKTEN